MGWDWAAGYVQQKSTQQVKEAVQRTIESETNQVLQLSPEPVLPLGFELSFACVSEQVNNWTAFWYDSFWFSAKVFQTQKLTGLLMGAEGKSLFPEDQYACYWEYLIWHQGVLKNWFISNVELRFREVEKQYNFLLVPYLKSMVATRDADLSVPKVLFRIVDENNDIFSNNMGLIMPYAGAPTSLEDIQTWQSSSTVEALSRSPQILDIPFVGTNYNLKDIIVHLDIQRGEVKPPAFLNHFNIHAENPYERSPEWKNTVSRFELLFFTTNEKGIDYDSINELFWDLV